MVNTLWLRTFCTLVEVGHFTRAATQLHMTQSGVSQHIRKLEDFMGVALIMRDGKRFAVTDAGKRLYQESQAILSGLAELEQRVKDDPPFEGRVRVMSPGSLGLKLYPRLLELQQQWPSLVIDYRFAPNQDVEQAILDDRIELGLMTRTSEALGIDCQRVASEELLLVTHRSVKKVDWKTLSQLGFIDHPDGAHHADLLLKPNFHEYHHKSQFEIRGFSNQIGLILQPVSLGIGFTVLPAYAVEAFGEKDRLKIHRLSHSVSEDVFLLTRRNRMANRVQTVVETIRQCL